MKDKKTPKGVVDMSRLPIEEEKVLNFTANLQHFYAPDWDAIDNFDALKEVLSAFGMTFVVGEGLNPTLQALYDKGLIVKKQ